MNSAMNTQDQQPPDVDAEIDEQLERDVADYLDLAEHIEKLAAEQATIKARLAKRPIGKHVTRAGIVVTVNSPSRTFNSKKAWDLLTPDQQAVCTSPDAKKIKSQLAGVIVESLMEPGTGNPSVSIK